MLPWISKNNERYWSELVLKFRPLGHLYHYWWDWGYWLDCLRGVCQRSRIEWIFVLPGIADEESLGPVILSSGVVYLEDRWSDWLDFTAYHVENLIKKLLHIFWIKLIKLDF